VTGLSERGGLFEGVAELYAKARPSYPEPLIDRVIELAGLGPGARILEIGCGAGQATMPFAARGYQILCLEPGPELGRLTRERTSALSNVVVETTTFEAWQLRPEAFDLVMSAQAFHWVQRDVGMHKAADALRPGGSLVLIWNRPHDAGAPYRPAFDAAYREHAPSCDGGESDKPLERWIGDWRSSIEQSGRFGPVTVERLPWTCQYDATRYLELINTYSANMLLPRDARAGLDAALAAEIERQGGTITVGRVAVLFLAATGG
jgi:SAM-dependent methyltransferase